MARVLFTLGPLISLCSTPVIASEPLICDSPCGCRNAHGKGRWSVKTDQSLPPMDARLIQAVTFRTSAHEHIALSSKSSSSCYTCAPITDHQCSGGVAERLIAPVLKTGRPKGLVSSNLTPSAIFKFRLSIVDFRLVAIGSTLQQARIKFPEPLRKRRQRDNGRRYTSLRLRSESGWGGTQGRRADAR